MGLLYSLYEPMNKIEILNAHKQGLKNLNDLAHIEYKGV